MSRSDLGLDLGTTGGTWLIKQGDLLLGPVPFSKLVELLYAGEVTGSTPVSPHGGDTRFQPLERVEAFRVHLAKAQAKLRVEAQSQAQQRTEKRGQVVRGAIIATVILLVLGSGGRFAWWLAIHRPWEKQIQLPEPVITEELPTIKLASARGGEEELTYPDARAPVRPNGTRPAAPKPTKPSPTAKPGALASAQPARPGAMVDDDVNSLQQWDQNAINGVVKANKTTLHRCLSDEVKRQKQGTWQARIPIEFTIGNDGRVSKLWIDNPDYKSDGTELYKCMFGELRKWRFPSYQGEQANVSLAFSIQAR